MVQIVSYTLDMGKQRKEKSCGIDRDRLNMLYADFQLMDILLELRRDEKLSVMEWLNLTNSLNED
jgi:hypothetical protein